MGQYLPLYRAAEYPGINRRLTEREYARAAEYMHQKGITDEFLEYASFDNFCGIKEGDGADTGLARNEILPRLGKSAAKGS